MAKVIDRDFIRSLGNNIQRSADTNLPGAARSAASAVDTMQGAGQSGGILVAAAFFFACEYAHATLLRKQEEAEELNEALRKIAENWQAVEDLQTIPPNI